MKRKTFLFTMIFICIAGFVFASAKNPVFINPAAENGMIAIKKSRLSKDAAFVNYKAGDITVQLIAVVADDGTYRLSFNTCQSCNPSPNAYFAQEGKNLVCQNCGNQFTMNDVGAASYGCNPAMIPYTQTDSELIVSTEILEKVAPAFKRWQGPVE
ncbi:MAG: DUF2318 domain-containing protein [Spirochaetaceae bacterium]|nr:DUF2318 domain-containing protein [Spirochaetaceae bacterium]